MINQSRIQVRRLEVDSEELGRIDPLEFCKEKIDFISKVYEKVLDRIRIDLSREYIGVVTNYYNQKQVAVVKLSGKVRKGDIILIEGRTRSFTQAVNSMEIEGNKVDSAIDCDVGIKLDSKASFNDKVFNIIDRLPKKETR